MKDAKLFLSHFIISKDFRLKKVLFICLGNICRSPTAEGVFQSYVEREGLQREIEIDSAGTSGHHLGDLADSRMRKHAQKRGYELTSRSRQFDPRKDFEGFDYLVVMDDSNKRDILSLDTQQDYENKVFMMTDFSKQTTYNYVPDPYYGGAEGFEKVLDIVEDASEGLLEVIKKELN